MAQGYDGAQPLARIRGFRLELREEARDWQSFGDRFQALEDNIEKVVRGKHAQIRLALVVWWPRDTC